MINATKLLVGSAMLSLLYGLIGPKNVGTVFYLNSLLIEAALFTLIIIWAQDGKRTIASVVAPLAAATLNLLLNLNWLLVLALPAFFAEAMNLSSASAALIGYAFFGSVTAVLYCLLLDFVLRPSYINYRTYLAVAVGCAMAGLPALTQDAALFLPLHKALWWLLFSAGLILTSRDAPDNRLQPA